MRTSTQEVSPIEESQPRYGDPVTVFPRLGQGSFRLIVTDSYDIRCAFTNSPVLHVLDAAHIRPYSSGGTHVPSNGILLRQDLHTLFDRGYMTVTPSHRIEVSPQIKEEFHNGKEYYRLHGETMRLPEYGDRRHLPNSSDGTTTTSIAANSRSLSWEYQTACDNGKFLSSDNLLCPESSTTSTFPAPRVDGNAQDFRSGRLLRWVFQSSRMETN